MEMNFKADKGLEFCLRASEQPTINGVSSCIGCPYKEYGHQCMEYLLVDLSKEIQMLKGAI